MSSCRVTGRFRMSSKESKGEETIMKNRDIGNNNKSRRKQKRAYHRLVRDMNIKCCDDPTQYVMVCNEGLVTGLKRETLERVINSIIPNYDLIMPPGKSYCFLNFSSSDDAQIVYNQVHGCLKLQGKSTPLYLSFTESIPNLNDESWNSPLPPGLTLIENFITKEEETALLMSIDWKQVGTVFSELKHRQVKHFGYEFRYDTNRVDPNNPIVPIPENYKFLQSLFEMHGCGAYEYDQLTINHYLPGQGIPPHIDTHSPFEDTILSLSLGSACVMDFKRGEQKTTLLLPPCSLLVMKGEARYAWSHGIGPRHSDVIKTKDGVTTQQRQSRTSLTFRKVRQGDCCCNFEEFCDTKRSCSTLTIDNATALGLERSFVHNIYEEISEHFNETRHKPWPNVIKFLNTVEKGGLLLDIGCGNGKYLCESLDVFKMGCDRSYGLTEVCRNRGFEILLADCLQLPYKSNSLDAVISIAVIHHLSTHERRKRAISEIIRVLRPGGKCLIYVWAKEQKKNSIKSTYLKFNTSRKERCEDEARQRITECGVTLPIHENRTEFTHNDMLVPWKRKGGGNFLRFYHVFEESELPKLCSEVSRAKIVETYYDQGNWCTILYKT